jgi:N-acetyl sugar amidotransferase
MPTPTACSKCLLDTSMEGVVIEANTQCNFCNGYENYYKSFKQIADKPAALKAQLAQIIKDGKGKEYDCIIGLSGGVDSSFIAYMCKKEWGLRPLAVHLDNGWNDELAVSNIEKICKQLDIDLHTHVIDWHEFKDLQLSFIKASVANVETPTDHAIFACLFSLCSKYQIKYILDGSNHQTEYNRVGFTSGGYTYADYKHIKAVHKQFGSIKLATFPKLQFWKRSIYTYLKGINRVSLLNLYPYIKSDAMRLLQTELGWTPYSGKHHESLFTKWQQCVYLPKKFHYDKRVVHLSDLILSGQITRENAVAQLAQSPVSDSERQELEKYVQKKFGMTDSEYQSIFTTPTKNHKDYPNNEALMVKFLKIRNILRG